jgi:HlyD family secretion protein
MPEVTDADCKKVTDALAAKPAVSKRLDEMRGAMRGASDEDRQKMRAEQESLYKQLGVDQMVANACRFRDGGGRGGPAGGQAGGRQGGARGDMQGGTPSGAQGTAQAAAPPSGMGAFASGRGGAISQRRQNPNATPRSGLVFVQSGTTWEPRVLRLGIANYDFTEVVSGVEEGERVALMSAAILQLRRQEQMDRTKAMASPLGGTGGMGGMGGPGGGRGGGGGPPGGGRGN